MAIKSTSAPVRMEPTGQDDVDEDKRVAYLVKVPSVYDRAAYRRQVKARGARLFMPAEMRQSMRTDVAAANDAGAFSKDEARAANATIDAFEAALAARDGDADTAVPDKLLQAFMDFEESVRGLGGEYAGRLAENEYYLEIAMIEAVRMFVVGWENVDADFKRVEPVGLSENSLQAISDDHLRQIDGKVGALMAPGGTAEKNLNSPSPGPSGPATSQAAKPSQPKTRRTKTKTSGVSRKSASKN